jgi:hypothetical protein
MAEPKTAHMADDVSARGVLLAALAIGGGIAVSIGAAFLLVHEASVPVAVQPPDIASATKLQPAPAPDFAAYIAEKRNLLKRYAWVDRERGVVRIPIERAMEILSQRQAS